MSRFYAPKENVKGNLIYIDGQEAKHILNVMRLKDEDRVVVFDGTGREYAGFIKETKPKSLVVEVVSVKTPPAESLPSVTLAQAIPKKEKMDYIVEKSTELGVAAIIPLVTERTIVRPDASGSLSRIERWKKISLAAAKQCARSDVPEIKGVQKFYNTVDEINDYDLSVLACLSAKTLSLKEALSDFRNGRIIVFIGPEGDFTPAEIEMAERTACKLVTLGRRVLKSDTAGLYALSCLNYEFSR